MPTIITPLLHEPYIIVRKNLSVCGTSRDISEDGFCDRAIVGDRPATNAQVYFQVLVVYLCFSSFAEQLLVRERVHRDDIERVRIKESKYEVEMSEHIH